MPLFRKKGGPSSPHRKKESPTPSLSSRTGSLLSLDSVEAELRNGDVNFIDVFKEKCVQGEQRMMPKPKRNSTLLRFDLESSSYKLNNPLKTHSRLSKTLSEILHDQGALGYFFQFMESRGGLPLLKFWLDAESFQASSWTRIRTNSIRRSCKNLYTVHNSPQPSDSLNNNGTIQTIADIRQHRNLTSQTQEGDEDVKILRNSGSYISPDLKNTEIVECSESPPLRRDSSQEDSLGDKIMKNIERDAISIFSKYVAQDATCPIGIDDDKRSEIIGKICREDGQVDPECFQSAQKLVFQLMDEEYLPLFLRSECHCKHQIDVLTSSEVFLEDILYNDTAMFYFMEFMEQEGAMHFLEFWLAADNFRQHLQNSSGNYDPMEVQTDAMVLYDKYFSLQATCPLGFDDTIRIEIEGNICREEGPLPSCFELPLRIVLGTFEQVHFPQFLQSQLYFKYLSELICAIQSRPEFPVIKKRSGSDASSEKSVCSQNTLLAMESNQPGTQMKKMLKNICDDMSIDSGQFHPDALWKRPQSGDDDSKAQTGKNSMKLSIGHVNEFGQFITEFEPEPDRKKSGASIIAKAMKKLVSKEEDKAKEDMAWQIAQMIIKDVQNMTENQETIETNEGDFVS